ncbi:uncharacterized protein DMAD_02402 [Drosophila madeirensis]|uniref:SH2 domain-containing adapter protein D n=1 Tax=Drosophila madeirensis TaxID=30013 RepID=A0AAU9G6B6_DROMD
MERMWRKVNHSLRSTKSQSQQQQSNVTSGCSGAGTTATSIACGASGGLAATPHSTDTINSAGGFGDAQLVVAVQGLPSAAATSAGAVVTAACTTTATVTATVGSNATGRRLASIGQTLPVSGACKSLSQHVLQTRTASSERRRRRRRKSRPRRGGGMGAVTSCVGDPSGDNMSSSGGFYTLKDHHQYHRHGHHGHGAVGGGGSSSSRRLFATSAPSGTVMMYPNPQRAPTLTAAVGSGSGCGDAVGGGPIAVASAGAGAVAQPDISLRQRAVAKLRMFNFHLNWDLHMTHCKPCGPRLSGSGNIITRRLCRNRRREDNELYRSNSFKFERFERKECLEELSNTLQKQIAICDDYSLPVDFVKKRPSSFDPCLAEAIPSNPEHWIVASPQQTECLPFGEAQQATQQLAAAAVPPLPIPLATLPIQQAAIAATSSAAAAAQQQQLQLNNNNNNTHIGNQSVHQQQHHNKTSNNNNTLPVGAQQVQHQQPQQRATLQHPPLPNSNIKQASVKLIEGYSDPKDTRHHSSNSHHRKVYHKKVKRRTAPSHNRHQQQQQQQQKLQHTLPTPRSSQQQQQQLQRHSTYNNNNDHQYQRKDKRNSHYDSESSAPKSSDEEADIDEEADQPQKQQSQPKQQQQQQAPSQTETSGTTPGAVLNSPDSISDDLVRPLPPQLQRSPRKLTVAPAAEYGKRQPSPYYYSDLLKSRDKDKDRDREKAKKEAKQKCRQSTASESPQQRTELPCLPGGYRKSSSLDVRQQEHGEEPPSPAVGDSNEDNENKEKKANNDDKADDHDHGQRKKEADQQEEEPTEENDRLEEEEKSGEPTGGDQSTPKRYSFTEEGVHIIRCETPSTSTSEESDCSECLKRREWHARALALVRKTCNVQPRHQSQSHPSPSTSSELQLQLQHCDAGEGELLKCCPPLPANATNPTAATSAESSPPMPPHRLLGPAAVCGACIATTQAGGGGGSGAAGRLSDEPEEELEEYFRPRSIFYVHPHGVHECAECAPIPIPIPLPLPLPLVRSEKLLLSGRSASQSVNTLYGDDEREEEDDDVDADADEGEEEDDPDSDIMANRRRQIYETAFDCKIAKSDDDLDEVDRITNHSVLLQLSNGNSETVEAAAAKAKSRLECKRTKNSKNQALQEQNSDGHAHVQVHHVQAELGNMQLEGDHQNQNQSTNPAAAVGTVASGASASSTQQLPVRGYTPSPPSTAPLPMKFPGKQERYMNSIKSAPNLPATNPAHPRLRDLRLPLQAMRLHQQQQQPQPQQLCASSNDNSLTDSAYVNPPSTNSNSASAGASASASVSVTASASAAARRPRSFVLESGRVLELRRSAQPHPQQQRQHHHHHHHHAAGVSAGRRTRHGHGQRQGQAQGPNYSSTESIATSSSGGSMESLRSSTSEGNRSTSSSESRHSSSLSSHSSESGSSSVAYPLRPAPLLLHSKLHILSPISDKSSQEPASVSASEQSQQPSQSQPQATSQEQQEALVPGTSAVATSAPFSSRQQRNQRGGGAAPNKALLHLADELLGSDSGISLHSREEGKPLPALAVQRLTLPKLQLIGAEPVSQGAGGGSSAAGSSGTGTTTGAGGASGSANVGIPQELRDLPFDMPKLRRRKTLQQEAACTSGSATSVDLGELPFDMPKLRRRLRANQAEINNLLMHSTESSGISQASSSHSMREDKKLASKIDTALFRQNLTLNLSEPRQAAKQFGSLDLRGLNSAKELNINICQGYVTAVDLIDVSIPLERQGWYHGAITRIEAETTLRPLSEGSFLVRNCESTKQDYSLSLKGAKGFMHMRIQRNETGQYILGQFSRPFDTVPDMIRHFCLNRLPVRGAEHMCLIEPVIAQLL